MKIENIDMEERNIKDKDMLVEIFEIQKAFQKRLGNLIKMNKSNSSLQQFINQMFIALIEESVEILRTTAYKNPKYVEFGWKKEQKFNLIEFKNELVDLFHFFINLCIAAKLDAKEFFELYKLKNQENYRRQDSGY